MLLKRVADACVNLYAMTAVISRATQSINQGLSSANEVKNKPLDKLTNIVEEELFGSFGFTISCSLSLVTRAIRPLVKE